MNLAIMLNYVVVQSLSRGLLLYFFSRKFIAKYIPDIQLLTADTHKRQACGIYNSVHSENMDLTDTHAKIEIYAILC